MGYPGIEAYRRQQLEGMKPEQLVLVAFEQGVLACRRREKRRAQRVVIELIGALVLQYRAQAEGFLALYDWVLQLLGEDRFEEAGAVLDRLRAAWEQALTAPAGGTAPAGPAERRGGPSSGALPPDLQG